MELKEYFRILLKRCWIALIIPLFISGLSACITIFALKPVYEANITLYVINKSLDRNLAIAYNEVIAGQYLAKEYRELVKSRIVTGQVIEELMLIDMDHKTLAEKINVNAKNDTRIFEIKVQDTDPKGACNFANTVGEVFINKVISIMNVENVSIIDKALTPQKPIKPNLLINIIIAFLFGIISAVGMIFLLEYLDDTINTSEDVEKHLGLSTLGIIPLQDLK